MQAVPHRFNSISINSHFQQQMAAQRCTAGASSRTVTVCRITTTHASVTTAEARPSTRPAHQTNTDSTQETPKQQGQPCGHTSYLPDSKRTCYRHVPPSAVRDSHDEPSRPMHAVTPMKFILHFQHDSSLCAQLHQSPGTHPTKGIHLCHRLQPQVPPSM